ncbi:MULTISPECIES: hypothetical protein [unclassified Colwellia]|uniref:hypothetical protein n=1 Tax=unclassified Colwellia TaxID=196834 RepID=UPI0015F5C6C6|nr:MULTISPECIES: hypothetical protein [unclassified Colwellia]MBA6378990.1 hypothetical protein [Colwellia sp. BRX10-7]MBA6386595.1 hypothetical protein [Colwellia sp. BRX10-2]MBA6401098.1 hypothetical protein [Colwellia sp. BRX10-5]MBA6405713.1 hypothetical protein [Colwellia sp. BRX10-1]
MNHLNKLHISLLLGMTISTLSSQSFANNNIVKFIDELPQEIENFTPDKLEEMGSPYDRDILVLSTKYSYQQDKWPSDAIKVASKHIRFNICKEKAGHYVDFLKDTIRAKEFGEPFTFKDIVNSNNGSYFISIPLTDIQREHPIKGPIQLAFEHGWKDQGTYKINDYFSACLSIPLSGYINAFKQHGFFVGAYYNL